MLKSIRIQLLVLVIHGALAFWVALSLFYLRATMTNRFFEGIAVVVAILLAAAALILGACGDWAAAWAEGLKHLYRLTFYLLAGLASAIAGVFLAIYSPVSMQWLVLFAALHALVFGLLGLALAGKAKHHALERGTMYIFGAVSLFFFGMMAGVANRLDDRSATVILGVYLCFVAAKLFVLAWTFHRMSRIGERPGLDARHHHSAPFVDPIR